ncbi:unnamed protein product [Victoria cruziana]
MGSKAVATMLGVIGGCVGLEQRPGGI